MRISDWSSDVCSSDLGLVHAKLVQKLRREGEKLDIGGRFARADDFRVKLMELAEAPFLRPLVTDERPPCGKLQRRPLLPALADLGAGAAGRELRSSEARRVGKEGSRECR